MKKTVIACSALLLTVACNKDTEFIQPALKSGEGSDYSSYEEYEEPENVEAFLLDFLEDCEDDNLSNMDVNEALWAMEGGINYLFAEDNFDFESIDITPMETAEISLSEGLASAADIKDLFDDVFTTILAELGDYDRLITSDFYVVADGESTISVKVDLVLGRSISIIQEAAQPPYIPAASIDRKASVNQDCNNNTTTSAKDECAKSALIGYRRKFGPMPSRFYTQVRTTTPSSIKLFGNTNCIVSDHDITHQPLPAAECITTAEQDIYAKEMMFKAITSSGGDVLNIKVKNVSSQVSTMIYNFWEYQQVKYGTGHLAQQGYAYQVL